MLYRTTDNEKWGAGKEVKLTSNEIDNNFWEVITRLVAVENNPPQPNQISNITLTGSQLSIHLSDGTIFGPYTLPIAVMYFRGEWTAETDYFELDIVSVSTLGLYLVLRDHTSDVVFDPEAAIAEGSLYHWLIGNGSTAFLELSDTPEAFGTAGQLVAVNVSGDGMVFIDPPTEEVVEAPIDGNPYVRWNGSWQVMPVATVTWGEIEGKPLTFPPDVHGHDWGDITSGIPALIAALPDVVGGDGQVLKASGGAIVWGTDIAGEGGTGITWADIADKPALFPPEAHTHEWSDITTTGKQTFAASTADFASIRVPPGAVPTVFEDGDLWTTTAQLSVRLNGINRTIAFINMGQTWGEKQTFRTPIAAVASIRLPAGVDPTEPQDGDVWTTVDGFKVHLSGVTNTMIGGNGTITATVALTQAEYDALDPKNPTTHYLITDA